MNHLELLLAALVLTGALTIGQLNPRVINPRIMGVFGLALLGIAALSTYVFTPWISGLGLAMEGQLVSAFSQQFNWIHGTYLALELIKVALLVGSIHLLRTCLAKESEVNSATL